MAAAGGWVAPGFEGVRDAFAAAQADDEGGAQLCVYRRGERVVDLWAGRDKANDRPYGEDTLTVLMSCTKGAVAACAHILAERGLLDFDAPVARYWPDFAQAGKADVRVWHLLTHSVGLPSVPPDSGIGAREMMYADKHVGALAAMAPVWEPGTAYIYHPITYGSLLGEVVRRVSGKSFSQFFADEIAGPLNLDFWIGLPEAQDHRVAPHFQVGPALDADQIRTLIAGMGVDVETRLAKTILHSFKTTGDLIEIMKTREGRAAEVPAGNGIGDARALAKMYAALIGEVDGVRLIKPATMERARTLRTGGLTAPGDLTKLVFGDPQRFGLGFELSRPAGPMLGEGSFGHAGAGGRMGFAHPESGVAVAYVANTMLTTPTGADPRWVGWTAALREAVGV